MALDRKVQSGKSYLLAIRESDYEVLYVTNQLNMYKNGQLVTIVYPWWNIRIVGRIMKRDRMKNNCLYLIPTTIAKKLPKGSWIQVISKT